LGILDLRKANLIYLIKNNDASRIPNEKYTPTPWINVFLGVAELKYDEKNRWDKQNNRNGYRGSRATVRKE